MRCLVTVLACGLLGCVGEMPDRPPAPLAIGQQAADGTFQFLHDGDFMPVKKGPNGNDMISPCLLGAGMDPVAPLAEITVRVDGVVVGGLMPAGRPDLRDGVMWDERVMLTTPFCCYVGRPAEVTAKVEDASHRHFEGRVEAVLGRTDLPDDAVCCELSEPCAAPFEGPACE
jgi:hypothetical protein